MTNKGGAALWHWARGQDERFCVLVHVQRVCATVCVCVRVYVCACGWVGGWVFSKVQAFVRPHVCTCMCTASVCIQGLQPARVSPMPRATASNVNCPRLLIQTYVNNSGAWRPPPQPPRNRARTELTSPVRVTPPRCCCFNAATTWAMELSDSSSGAHTNRWRGLLGSGSALGSAVAKWRVSRQRASPAARGCSLLHIQIEVQLYRASSSVSPDAPAQRDLQVCQVLDKTNRQFSRRALVAYGSIK